MVPDLLLGAAAVGGDEGGGLVEIEREAVVAPAEGEAAAEIGGELAVGGGRRAAAGGQEGAVDGHGSAAEGFDAGDGGGDLLDAAAVFSRGLAADGVEGVEEAEAVGRLTAEPHDLLLVSV